ncbi:MAG: T9SS type A sorting domain-containing protein [Flavobacteriales bacterium]|nr:T9SS type A sorting domain-containing protein [Flavobacteriales bacterium]
MNRLLLLALICLSPVLYNAQTCSPPLNPQLMVDGVMGEFVLTWTEPFNSECDVLYYEIEYGMPWFMPGMGVGTLVTPVYGDTYYFFEWTEMAWIRSICDCDDGEGGPADGYPDAGSEWVEASVTYVAYPDDGVFCPGPEIPVLPPVQCGEWIEGYQEVDFKAPFEYDAQFTPSCVGSSLYVLWRNFVAPESGAVTVSTSTIEFAGYDPWYDMGFVVGSSCLSVNTVCVNSMSNDDPQLVDGLTPGDTYVIGLWANGYNYYYDGGGSYNGVSSLLSICEAEGTGEDYGVYADETLLELCPTADIQPEYELGFSWGETTVVTISSIQGGPCGTITFTIDVMDEEGHSGTAQQEVVFSDDEAPYIIGLPFDTLWVSCDSIPEMEFPVATDNCGEVTWIMSEDADVLTCSYDIVRTYIAQDACGNESMAQQVIHVSDNAAPVFINTPESYMSLECGTEVVPLMLEAEDNCWPTEVTYEEYEEAIGCTSQMYRIWMATDSCANTTTFAQVIQFYDDVAPEILCPDTLNLTPEDGSSNVLMPLLSLEIETVEEACDAPITWVQDPPAGIVLAPGIHFATFSATDQCGNTSECEFVLNVDQIDGIREGESVFGLYPVPASDYLWIDLDVAVNSLEISVQDATGRVIERQALQVEGSRFQLAIDHLPNGVYTLSIFNSQYQSLGSETFIIQR